MSNDDRFEEEFRETFGDYTLAGPPEEPEALDKFLDQVAGDKLIEPKYGYLERVVLMTERGVGVYECCEVQVEEKFQLTEDGQWTYEAVVYYWLRHPGGMLGLAGRWREDQLVPEKA